MQSPIISVIVPSFNAGGTIARALRALERQQTSVPYEVIVVDSGTDGAAELVAREFPAVRLVRSAERKYAGGARNLGIAGALGKILAFTDADCLAAPDWIDAVARAHEGPDAVVGGSIGNGNPASYVGWGYYFAEFNNWLPGTPRGVLADVAGCCWSMKRRVYEEYGPFLEGTYCSDTAFHWRLAAHGVRPAFDPRIRVDHLNPERFAHFSRHEAFHGRCFASVRSRERRFTRLRALGHASTVPLLPFVLFGRVAKRALARPLLRRQFLRSSPMVFWGVSAWSWGELQGYLRHGVRGSGREGAAGRDG